MASTESQHLEPATAPKSSVESDKNVEHALCNKWQLIFDDPSKLPPSPTDEQYANNLKDVCELDTVESFWRLYNNMEPVEKLYHCNLHLFKKGIKPAWEDPQNENGGKWVVQNQAVTSDCWMKTTQIEINRKSTQYFSAVNGQQLQLLTVPFFNLAFPFPYCFPCKKSSIIFNEYEVLSVIGGVFGEHNDSICGVVANLKKVQHKDKLSLWLSTTDKRVCEAIGRRWKEIIKFNGKLEFKPHKSSMRSKSSYLAAALYFV
eukprot:gene2603-8097_t